MRRTLATLGAFANGRLSFNLGATGLENGRNRVLVTAFDSSGNRATSIAQLVIYRNNRPALAGAYTGLLAASGAPTNNTTGFVALNVTPLGVFTGRVTIGRSSLVVRGLFDNAGVAHFNETNFTTLAPTSFVLRETVGGTIRYGTIALGIAPDKITGTLKNTLDAVVANIDATARFLTARLAPWRQTTSPTTVPTPSFSRRAPLR